MALTIEQCLECHKEITVCQTSPDTDEQKTTGMAAHHWASSTQEETFAGWICKECAWNLQADGKGILGFDGYGFDFVYN